MKIRKVVWEWITGEPLIYRNWDPGEPVETTIMLLNGCAVLTTG